MTLQYILLETNALYIVFFVYLSDLTLNCLANVFPAFMHHGADEVIDVIECCQTEQGGDEARPWIAGCFTLYECILRP